MLDRQFLAILREEGAGLPIRTVRLGAEGLGKSIHPGVRRGEEDVDCIASVLTLAQTMGQWEDKQKNGRAVASTASVSRGSHKCRATTRPIQRVRYPVHEQGAWSAHAPQCFYDGFPHCENGPLSCHSTKTPAPLPARPVTSRKTALKGSISP